MSSFVEIITELNDCIKSQKQSWKLAQGVEVADCSDLISAIDDYYTAIYIEDDDNLYELDRQLWALGLPSEILIEFNSKFQKNKAVVDNLTQYTFNNISNNTDLLFAPTLNVIPTQNNMSIFNGCLNLMLVYPLTIPNTILSIARLFYNCNSLQYVDCANWDLSNITSIFRCFYQCGSLKTIKNIDLSSKYIDFDPNYPSDLHSNFLVSCSNVKNITLKQNTKIYVSYISIDNTNLTEESVAQFLAALYDWVTDEEGLIGTLDQEYMYLQDNHFFILSKATTSNSLYSKYVTPYIDEVSEHIYVLEDKTYDDYINATDKTYRCAALYLRASAEYGWTIEP